MAGFLCINRCLCDGDHFLAIRFLLRLAALGTLINWEIMQTTTNKKFIFIISMFASSASQAVSFDCAKAAPFVEKAICTDSLLGKLDDTLDYNYKQMRSANIGEKAEEDLKATQKKWLLKRNKCTDSKCIEDSYRERIDGICEYPVISGLHPECTPSDNIKATSSSDCSKATGSIEEKNCNDDLKNEKSRLNLAYKKLFDSLPQDKQQQFEAEQKTWLTNRDSTCGKLTEETPISDVTHVTNCILDSVRQRADELEKASLLISKEQIKNQQANQSQQGDWYKAMAKPSLVVRSEPNVVSEKVGNVSYGDKIKVIEKNIKEDAIDGHEGKWVKIEWENSSAYVFDDFLEVINDDGEKNNIEEWYKSGYTKDEVNEWSEYKFSLDDAKNWHLIGESPYSANEWIKIGETFESAKQWKGLNINPSFCKDIKEAGIDYEKYKFWTGLGVSLPSDINNLTQVGFDDETAKSWSEFGVPVSDWLEYKKLGLNLKDIEKWSQAGANSVGEIKGLLADGVTADKIMEDVKKKDIEEKAAESRLLVAEKTTEQEKETEITPVEEKNTSEKKVNHSSDKDSSRFC